MNQLSFTQIRTWVTQLENWSLTKWAYTCFVEYDFYFLNSQYSFFLSFFASFFLFFGSMTIFDWSKKIDNIKMGKEFEFQKPRAEMADHGLALVIYLFVIRE